MGWAFWSVDHVKQSHSGGPPPVPIKMSSPGVAYCQPGCGQFGSVWDGPLSFFHSSYPKYGAKWCCTHMRLYTSPQTSFVWTNSEISFAASSVNSPVISL